MSIFEFINTIVENVMNDLGTFAPVLACFLIIIESIFPILPLSIFIAINAYYMGYIPCFIISYVLTCVGCYISYSFCSNKLKTHYYNMLDKTEHRKLKRVTKQIQKLKLEELSLIIAMPFTPAFLVNIASGLAGIDKKKFIISILIGKISLVLFWEFIGTSLIESINNPVTLIKICLIMLIAFIISKIVSKKLRME